MKTTLNCPVNFKPVDQTIVRLVALQVFLLSAAFLLVQHWSIAAVLVVDFFFRAFNKGEYSVLGWLARLLAKRYRLPRKVVDSAPKIFAAQIGFFLAGCLLIASALQLSGAGLCLAAVLTAASFLEAFFGFCVGCHAYTLVQKFVPLKNPEGTSSL